MRSNPFETRDPDFFLHLSEIVSAAMELPDRISPTTLYTLVPSLRGGKINKIQERLRIRPHITSRGAKPTLSKYQIALILYMGRFAPNGELTPAQRNYLEGQTREELERQLSLQNRG